MVTMEEDGKVAMPHFMVEEMHQAQWVSLNKHLAFSFGHIRG